jgi:prolipoprotein diacylglyceryltransferase
VLYGAFRFVNEFFRDNMKGNIFGLSTLTGLTTSQLISILIVVVSLTLLIIRRRKETVAANA